MGRCLRPDDGYHRRPHPDQVGQIPPLCAVVRHPLRRLWNPALLHSGFLADREARMGLCDLHNDDDGLHRHQCPLWCHARGNYPRLRREDRLLLLQDVLRLRRFVYRSGRVGTSLQPLPEQFRDVGCRRMAMGHDCDSRGVCTPLLPLLQDDPRAGEVEV